jgi:hypothetical protein
VGLLDDLRDAIAREESRVESERQQSQLGERLDRLEQSLGDRIGEAVASALKPQAGGGGSSPAAEPPAEGNQDEPEPEPEPEPELPVERVTRASVPHIWQGDDEPTSVRYLDADTGEEKTRKGRQKGKPAIYEVAEIGPDDDSGGEPAGDEQAA